jgi:hypothetical protein
MRYVFPDFQGVQPQSHNEERHLPSKMKYFFFPSALFCAFALVACVALSHPALNMAMNDDWSYIWSARVLASTGHIVYNGWATAILGWQLYLGALFIKLFGFSFTTVRISMLLVSMVTVALIQRLFVRFGVNEWNATVATLTIALSPLFLPLAYSFMSDVPGLLCVVLCFYCCVRAVQAGTDRVALGWLVFAALSNVGCGTVRQIAWLGALVIVPSSAWWMRRRSGALMAGVILWLVSVLAIVGCMHWFSLQRYSITEKLVAKSADGTALVEVGSALVRSGLAGCLFVLPVLIAFIVKYPFGDRRARRFAAIAGACFVLTVLVLVVRHKPVRWLAPFSHNYVTTKGLVDVAGIFGSQPDIFPSSVRIALTALTFAALISFLLFVWIARGLKDRTLAASNQFSWKALVTILGPYTLAYIFLLATRRDIFDRYLLPLLFVVLVFVLRLYEQKISDRLPFVSVFLVVLFAAFGVAGMHDLFAMDRARVAAADEVTATGVPRTQVQAGLEYDAWTQLEAAGYINENRLRVPAGAYHLRKRPAGVPIACYFWFEGDTPMVSARYALSYDQTSCFTPSQFAPVAYTTWFSPHHRLIYIQRVPTGSF